MGGNTPLLLGEKIIGSLGHLLEQGLLHLVTNDCRATSNQLVLGRTDRQACTESLATLGAQGVLPWQTLQATMDPVKIDPQLITDQDAQRSLFGGTFRTKCFYWAEILNFSWWPSFPVIEMYFGREWTCRNICNFSKLSIQKWKIRTPDIFVR